MDYKDHSIDWDKCWDESPEHHGSLHRAIDKLLTQRDALLEHIHGNEHSEQMSACQKCKRLLEDTD